MKLVIMYKKAVLEGSVDSPSPSVIASMHTHAAAARVESSSATAVGAATQPEDAIGVPSGFAITAVLRHVGGSGSAATSISLARLLHIVLG